MVVMFLWCVQEVAGLKVEDLSREYVDPLTLIDLATASVNPLTPIVAFWRHRYFRHHNFIKKC